MLRAQWLARRQRTSLTIVRTFSQNRQPFLFSSTIPRPQLPFLHILSQNSSPRIISRLLSTEQKKNFRDAAKDFAKWTAIFWAFASLLAITKFGIDNEILEREHPTPPSWSWISRWKLRSALGKEQSDARSIVEWASIGDLYQQLLSRLEDVACDGTGVRPPLGEGEEIFVEGVGQTGLDVTDMPESWRRGYHQALMGAGRAAEHLDSCVRDTKRNIVFSRDMVIGPSNPRPRPVPFGAPDAPKETNCQNAFAPPHVFYLKVLTTHGFSTRQRLDAAFAYADWLRHKGLVKSVEDVYSWALDIATEGLPAPTASMLNKSTGILGSETSGVSSNLLLVTTHLATHHASTGNLQAALPMFLSILRAQRDLPPPTEAAPLLEPRQPSFIQSAKTLLAPKPYPQPPASGDQPATSTPTSVCATAGIMLNIGELLYASEGRPHRELLQPSSTQSAGLSWTSQAVGIAEATLRGLVSGNGSVGVDHSRSRSIFSQLSHNLDDDSMAEPKRRCAECLTIGLQNWQKMLEPFQVNELKRQGRALQGKGQVGGDDGVETRQGWYWGASKAPLSESEALHESPSSASGSEGMFWVDEGKKVHERAIATRRLLRELGLEL